MTALHPDEVSETVEEPEPETENLPAIVDAPLTGELPTVPATNELQALAQLAQTFAHAALVPKALQGRPADCLLVLLTARDLGLSVTVAFRELHPIDGRVTASPKLKLAMIRQRRLGNIWPDADNDATSATWYAVRADDPSQTRYASTFTIADAKAANLASKDNWKHYPARMLSWRALGYLVDDAFSEVGTGLYSADELGAVTDGDGNVIEIAESDPLPGGEWRSETEQRQAARSARADTIADPADLWDLQEQIAALPEAVRDRLREAWKSDDSRLRGKIPRLLPAKDLRMAKAMVNAFWAEATKAGATKAIEIEAVRGQVVATVGTWIMWVSCGGPAPEAPDSPQDGPEPDPASPDRSTPPEDDDAPRSGESDETTADVDWVPVLRALADEVRAAADGVPEAEIMAMAAEIKALHHIRVNDIILGAGLSETYPPSSPIDLRRMAVTLIRLRKRGDEGTLPGVE